MESAVFDALTVQIRPVERSDVAHREAGPVVQDLGVSPGHRHVIQEYVAVGMAPDSRAILAQRVTRTYVRSPLDDQESDSGWQAFGRHDDLLVSHLACGLDGSEGDRGH
jgi:hypothetical protein